MAGDQIPDYVIREMRAVGHAVALHDAGQPDVDLRHALDGLMIGVFEWLQLRVEAAATTENRGLNPNELTVLRGLTWPLWEALHGQHGGDEVRVRIGASRLRKMRQAIFPPSPALAAVSGLYRTAKSEAERRHLRSIEYPEPTKDPRS